jgi:hypothetical protein
MFIVLSREKGTDENEKDSNSDMKNMCSVSDHFFRLLKDFDELTDSRRL